MGQRQCIAMGSELWDVSIQTTHAIPGVNSHSVVQHHFYCFKVALFCCFHQNLATLNQPKTTLNQLVMGSSTTSCTAKEQNYAKKTARVNCLPYLRTFSIAGRLSPRHSNNSHEHLHSILTHQFTWKIFASLLASSAENAKIGPVEKMDCNAAPTCANIHRKWSIHKLWFHTSSCTNCRYTVSPQYICPPGFLEPRSSWVGGQLQVFFCCLWHLPHCVLQEMHWTCRWLQDLNLFPTWECQQQHEHKKNARKCTGERCANDRNRCQQWLETGGVLMQRFVYSIIDTMPKNFATRTVYQHWHNTGTHINTCKCWHMNICWSNDQYINGNAVTILYQPLPFPEECNINWPFAGYSIPCQTPLSRCAQARRYWLHQLLAWTSATWRI